MPLAKPSLILRVRRIVAKGSGRGSIHHHRGDGDPKLYKPTDVVRLTGIYEVLHDREHRESHEVVMHARDLFPACDTCDMRVRFRLVRTAPYIFDDEDFESER
jgi:hypothetical protein